MQDLDDVVDAMMAERFAPTGRQLAAADAMAEMDSADYGGPDLKLDAEGMTLCCGYEVSWKYGRHESEPVCEACGGPVADA